eukprot:m.830010 g.830010  ORF g.830010 m.830010 type:complete len:63 (+) comp23425_c0_seq5:319-507(+)
MCFIWIASPRDSICMLFLSRLRAMVVERTAIVLCHGLSQLSDLERMCACGQFETTALDVSTF